MESLKEFFESLPSRATPENTAGMTNSYLFEITDAGTWRVAIDDGTLTVSEGDGEADVRIAMSEETLRKLVAGEQNPMRGVMTGKIKLKGDMSAATKLARIFG